MVERIFKILNAAGIHARPATILVNTAGKFSSEIYLQFEEKKANLKSIMGVMSLGLREGSEIKVIAEGTDEVEALQTIAEIIKKEGLGE